MLFSLLPFLFSLLPCSFFALCSFLSSSLYSLDLLLLLCPGPFRRSFVIFPELVSCVGGLQCTEDVSAIVRCSCSLVRLHTLYLIVCSFLYWHAFKTSIGAARVVDCLTSADCIACSGSCRNCSFPQQTGAFFITTPTTVFLCFAPSSFFLISTTPLKAASDQRAV